MAPEDGSPHPGGGEQDSVSPGPDQLDWWGSIKAVFLEALDYDEPERGEFVRRACGENTGLRDEVLSLLESEAAAASFCETPAAGLLGEAAPRSVPRLAPGTRLGAYEVTGFLSAGGMGEVYRARHTVLNRPVAIKTVSAELLADPGARRRLIREARHASVLTHPNICTIHEVGEAEGAPFIVMALVEGRPLSEHLSMTAPALNDALDYGVQIAEALAHAHEHGIVHRDLKSSNIVVDPNGRAIVLDFGLARRLRDPKDPPADSTVTGHGALAGTLGYMAPEVLLGELADARSDVWSLGVVLYELVTGALPFSGRTPYETSSAILGEPPQPMSGKVPLALRLVIERCLVKDPNGRYQSASEVGAALEAIRRRRAWPLVGRLLISARRRTLYGVAVAALFLPILGAAAPRVGQYLDGLLNRRITTLAVLPLENVVGDSAGDYHAAGLTDGLVAQLGSAIDIRIISSASAARIADSVAAPAAIARRLGADAIVTGRLRLTRERIAVDVRLFDGARGAVRWSDTFERPVQQALALQADLIRALAAEVRLTIRPGTADHLATVRAVNPEAYEAYLKGRYQWNQRTRQSLELAVAQFTRASELDPTYAPAHAALADCYNQLGTVLLGAGSPREYRPRAAAAAIRALQIDPNSAEAHGALGFVRHYEWEWGEAEREFRRAIELNPSYALAHLWYANLLMSLGRMEEALEQVYLARDLDPFSLIVNTNVGWVLTAAGRYQQAITHLTGTLALDPTYPQVRVRLVEALMGAGRYAEARDQAETLVRLTGRAPHAVAKLAGAAVALGRSDQARTLLAELRGRARHQYIPPSAFAEIFTALQEVDSALGWIGRAFDERSNYIAYLLAGPGSEPLMSDPRFDALITRVGLR